jgi:hypothetical protein
MAVGIFAMALIVFAKQLSGPFPALAPLGKIAWPWYVLIGTTITMTVGILSSLTHGQTDASGQAVT